APRADQLRLPAPAELRQDVGSVEYTAGHHALLDEVRVALGPLVALQTERPHVHIVARVGDEAQSERVKRSEPETRPPAYAEISVFCQGSRCRVDKPPCPIPCDVTLLWPPGIRNSPHIALSQSKCREQWHRSDSDATESTSARGCRSLQMMAPSRESVR